MNIIKKYDKPFEFAGIIMNLIIAYQIYLLWSQPQLTDVNKIYSMVILIVFEFFMVHSGALMALIPRKISLKILFPFYGLFAIIFSTILSNSIILIVYLLAVFNRMRFAFSDVSISIKVRAIVTSLLALLAYFILVFVILVGQFFISPLGLSAEFLEQSNYLTSSNTKGLFIEAPHIALAFGCIYYIIIASIEGYMLVVNPMKFRHIFNLNEK